MSLSSCSQRSLQLSTLFGEPLLESPNRSYELIIVLWPLHVQNRSPLGAPSNAEWLQHETGGQVRCQGPHGHSCKDLGAMLKNPPRKHERGLSVNASRIVDVLFLALHIWHCGPGFLHLWKEDKNRIESTNPNACAK